MLRPEGLLAPHRQGLLLSSFRRLDRSKPASRITTRANSQFPRPDLHRQETRHYGLRAKPQRRMERGRSGGRIRFTPFNIAKTVRRYLHFVSFAPLRLRVSFLESTDGQYS